METTNDFVASVNDDGCSSSASMYRPVFSAFTWKERTFVLKLERRAIAMKASVVHRRTPCKVSSHDRTVAVVTADLLSRPCSDFHDRADEHSGELECMACIFCEAHGVASRVKHPQLQESAILGGGFLHIETIEVNPEYDQADLSLRILHELFVLLKNKWTLAVLEPSGLTSSSSGSPPGNNNVMRHFARMKFVQATTKPDQYKAWFLTAETYFGNIPRHSYAIPSPSTLWLSKEQTVSLKILEAPRAQQGGLHPMDPLFDPHMVRRVASGLVAPTDILASSSSREDHGDKKNALLTAPPGILMNSSNFLPPQRPSPSSFRQNLINLSTGYRDSSSHSNGQVTKESNQHAQE